MLGVDWTISAIVFTISGAVLIWWRSKMVQEKGNTPTAVPKYDEEVVKKVFNKVVELFNEEKFFLNKNLKVADIATHLSQNEKIVSRAINQYGNGNFNAFVNSFRVGYAKELLVGGRHDHYTIEAIALECGFSNKVSFYNAFKNDMGMSPKEFKALKQ